MNDNYETLAVQQTINAWQSYNKRLDAIIEKLTEETWYRETAPARNRGIYILGHLIAVNDGMIALFGLGERKYKHLEKPFVTDPENKEADYPSVAELKSEWNKLNGFLESAFSKMTVADWFSAHTAVSAEDFEKNPMRNKLNVLMNRTSHQAYHIGQLIYLI